MTLPAELITFGRLDIAFDDRILRPRPWTIAQSRWAAEYAGGNDCDVILELCSGAGHIGLGLIDLVRGRLVQVDIDPVACGYARANATRAGLADRVEVRTGSMTEVIDSAERFSLIVADPPWVRSAQTSIFPADPLLAIDGGSDGLDIARLCLDVIAGHLKEDGVAIMQLGTEQQAEIIANQLRTQDVQVKDFGADGVLMRIDKPS